MLMPAATFTTTDVPLDITESVIATLDVQSFSINQGFCHLSSCLIVNTLNRGSGSGHNLFTSSRSKSGRDRTCRLLLLL